MSDVEGDDAPAAVAAPVVAAGGAMGIDTAIQVPVPVSLQS